MNIIQADIIFLNLLRQADEVVFSILGMNPNGDGGSFRQRVSALYNIFTLDKYNFVQSPTHLGFLATYINEYSLFVLPKIDSIDTPEILISAVSWEDIPNKPTTFPPAIHRHSWSDVDYKPYKYDPKDHRHPWNQLDSVPGTFPPDAHAHSYASVTDKPATFPPDAHTHDGIASDWNTLANKPVTFPPDAHVHPALVSLSFVHTGDIAANEQVGLVHVLPIDAQLLSGELYLEESGANGYDLFDIQVWGIDPGTGMNVWVSLFADVQNANAPYFATYGTSYAYGWHPLDLAELSFAPFSGANLFPSETRIRAICLSTATGTPAAAGARISLSFRGN